MEFIKLENACKIYKDGDKDFYAINNVNLKIDKGEMIAIMGPSGSGKSTLLNILGCIDNLSKGEYMLDDNNINKIKNKDLWKVRNKYLGFIFQYFALMKEYSALDNVSLPLTYRKISAKERRKLSLEALKNVGLENKTNKKPFQLSGGEQQRVAIARALVGNPKIILADEPTGALDHNTGNDIIKLIKDINEREGKTILIVTHDINVAHQCNRIININDGKIQDN